MQMLVAFLKDNTAATSIEYAVMASCIALVLVAAISNLGSTVKGAYTSVNVALK